MTRPLLLTPLLHAPLFRVTSRALLGIWLALALAVTTVVALLVPPRERPA